MRYLFFILLSWVPGLVNAQPEAEVRGQIDSLVSYIKVKATESFTAHTVYRGDNEQRKWKDLNNPGIPEELKAGKSFMEQMKKALNGCNYREFDKFKEERQSEGVWYVYTYACGSLKKIHFAFLKIRGKYALGDIDVENTDDE